MVAPYIKKINPLYEELEHLGIIIFSGPSTGVILSKEDAKNYKRKKRIR